MTLALAWLAVSLVFLVFVGLHGFFSWARSEWADPVGGVVAFSWVFLTVVAILALCWDREGGR